MNHFALNGRSAQILDLQQIGHFLFNKCIQIHDRRCDFIIFLGRLFNASF